jgi:hypothetical protein
MKVPRRGWNLPGLWTDAGLERRQVKTVPLGGKRAAGRVAVVDDADYGLVMQYSWHAQEDDYRRAGRRYTAYARTKTRSGKGLFMHTLITGWPLVDHEDCDGLNNQRANLRPATNSQNRANSTGYWGRVGFKGVYQRIHRGAATGKWSAAIRVDGKLRHLGTFADPVVAARVYDAEARAAFGEFARLNFPG